MAIACCSGSSTISSAVPFMRRVSRVLGTTKISPTSGFCKMFKWPSTKRLPRRSGISRLLSSSTFTNPGSSPLGDTSMAPDDDAVASSSSGDLPMNPIASSVRLLVFFCSVAGFGWPTTSRSCSMVSIFMRFYPWFIRPTARVVLV